MNATQEKLFLELRQTQTEIENSLITKSKNDWITPILEEELADVCSAMEKLRKGSYGQCEISGELIPYELLRIIPTLKSASDSKKLQSFYKIPLDASFL
jgi:RNA polymerase-binding transcription factor DksA